MYFIFNTKFEISDHENIGTDTFLVLIACTVIKILTDIDFSVMAALIKAFRVQSRTPDPPATLFYDEGGKPHQKIKSIAVALFA